MIQCLKGCKMNVIFIFLKEQLWYFHPKIQYGYEKLMPMITKVVSNIGH
jgi:hypothetical protein